MIGNPYGLPTASTRSPRVFAPSAVGTMPRFANSRRVGPSPTRTMTNLGVSTVPVVSPIVSASVQTIPSGYTLPVGTGAQQIINTGPIQGQSRLEYIPYERKYIDYETIEQVDRVPVERTVIDYQEVKKIEYVPRERRITDYYAIQHQTSYVPQTIPEKKIEYVPVETMTERIEYVPVQRQVVHYPEDYGVGLSRRATGVMPTYYGAQTIQANKSATLLGQPLVNPPMGSTNTYRVFMQDKKGIPTPQPEYGYQQRYMNSDNPQEIREESTAKKNPGQLMSFGIDQMIEKRRPQTEHQRILSQNFGDVKIPIQNNAQNAGQKILENQISNGYHQVVIPNLKGPNYFSQNQQLHRQNSLPNGVNAHPSHTGIIQKQFSLDSESMGQKKFLAQNGRTQMPKPESAQTGTRTLFKQNPPTIVESEYFAVKQSLSDHLDTSKKHMASTNPNPLPQQGRSGVMGTSKGKSSGIRLTVTSNKRPVSVNPSYNRRCSTEECFQ